MQGNKEESYRNVQWHYSRRWVHQVSPAQEPRIYKKNFRRYNQSNQHVHHYLLVGKKKIVYLPNGVHLEKFRSLVGDAHLKVGCKCNFDTCILSSNESLVCIFVRAPCMQDLQRGSDEPFNQSQKIINIIKD